MVHLGKSLIKRLLPGRWRRLLETLEYRLDAQSQFARQLGADILRQRYPALVRLPHRSVVNLHEMTAYSQGGEDGILLYLFSQIGATNHRVVEFGFGDGRECNAANLIFNFGWEALLLDCDAANVAAARALYRPYPLVRIEQALVTAENINTLLQPFAGEVDLLSIDIDGNDYWVWNAISVIQPRVVVVEYNASMGDTERLTVPYTPEFQRFKTHPSGYYHGASLAALGALGAEKGYQLVGCNRAGVNAFFVRTDLINETLPALTAPQAFYPNTRRLQRMSTEAQFALIAHLKYEHV